jgi:hypothetical protein
LSRRARRYIFFFAAVLLGLALGLVYGWVINPVVYKTTGMDTLRLDYKTDYVLMVAELYQSEGDLAMALARLSYLEAETPLNFVTTTINYAEGHNYDPEDIQRMWTLASAIDAALKTSN